MSTLSTSDGLERVLSDEEIARFRTLGWVRLDQLLAPDVVQGLLRRAKARMGAEAPLTVSRANADERTNNEYGWYARWDGCSHQDEWIRSISHATSLARIASSLMGCAVRFYFDHMFVKLPVVQEGGPTPWHQDLPHHPVDRQGSLTMWIPLVDCPAEMGTMRFLNRTHRIGLLGRFLNRGDGVSLVDEYPWVRERFDVSSPLDLCAGDATVHDMAIVHHAPGNTTPFPRWVYACQWLPVSARYTGAANHRTDGLGLKVDAPFEHPRFPAIET